MELVAGEVTTTSAADLKRWLHDHAQPPAGVGMGQSILLNVTTLAAGLVIFYSQRWCKKRRRSSSLSSTPGTERLLPNGGDHISRSVFEFGPGFHSTALNYLIFLRVAAELCTMLAVVSAAVVIPHWGVQPIFFGGFGGHISLAEDIDANGICLVGFLAFLSGLLVLIFAQRMKRHMRIRGAMHPKYIACLDRTLWLNHLPVGDYLTGKRFTLSEEDFTRVEESLKRAIEEQVRQKSTKPMPAGATTVLRVHVPFVVDDYYEVDIKHSEEKERLDARLAYLNSLQPKEKTLRNCCRRPLQDLHIWWTKRQVQALDGKVEKLRWKLESFDRGPKYMSGSAFVTFKEKGSKQLLLEDLPSCWKIQSYAHFNFGQPPFASVTLRCQRAPHPADVQWENLHISYRQRLLRFGCGSLLLLIFMLVLVTPVSVSSELNTIIPELRRGSHVIRHKVEHLLGVQLPEKDEVWQWLYLQLPPMVILFINSLVLPYLIGEICRFQRSHTLSKAELNQMNMNYVFMVFNQLLIPLFGLTGIPALLEFLEVKLNDQHEDISILQLLDGSMLRSPGVFWVRYLLNCTFLTNTNSLLNLPQLCVRWLTSTPEPWNFAWGYWYAFTLGMLTTAVSIGVLVPFLLPIAALFFAMKYRIDSHILSERAYLCGPESQGQFLPRVLFIMRMTVVGSWFVLGTSLQFTATTYFRHRWDAKVPFELLEGGCWLLVASSLFLGLFFFWAKGNDVHNAKFQFLRYSVGKKDLEGNLVDRCLDAIFGKLHQAVDSVGARPKRQYYAQFFPSEDGGISSASLNFSRRDSAEMEDAQTEDADFQLIWDCRRWLSNWKDYAKRYDLPLDTCSWSDLRGRINSDL